MLAVLLVPAALEQARREQRIDHAEDRDDRADLRPSARPQQVRVDDRDAKEEDRQAAEPHERVEQQPTLRQVVVIHRHAPDQVEHIERPLGDGDGARLDQLFRLVIAPARADRRSRRRAAAIAMSKLVSPTTMRRLGRRAGIGDRLLDHRRVRLGRVPVGGLQRDEARVDAVLFEAMLEAAIRLAGRDREQPAVLLERIEQFEHAVEQRLLDLARRAQSPECALVVLGQRRVLLGATPRAAAPPWLR